MRDGQAGSEQPGIRASALRIVAHVRTLARLEQELARTEVERKGKSLGAGAAVVVAAAVLALFAVGFGLAAAAAALALVIDWWLALLVVFLLLALAATALGLAARSLFRAGSSLAPTQAIEEARLTKQAVRGPRDG